MILQSPTIHIPEGPTWAVAIALVGMVIVATLHVVGKYYVKRDNGHRTGTRRTDDTKIDRAQIREEISVANMIAETQEIVVGLADGQESAQRILDKLSNTLAALERNAEFMSGLLSMSSAKTDQNNAILATIEERTKGLATKVDLLEEGTKIRHDTRNALAAAPLKKE